MSAAGIFEPLTGNRFVRRAADALLVRYARHRTAFLDHADPVRLQEQTLLKLVRHARNTRFGREHDFARVRSVADYQARVRLRKYEDFWEEYWRAVYPRLDNVTWPGKVPYYALSSGTTSGATKFIPVTREMLSSNRKAAFTNMAFFRNTYPKSQVFTGRIFFFGSSTQMRRQEDGSLAGDLSGIAARELIAPLRPYTFPPPSLSHIADWDTRVQTFAEASAKLPITVLSGIPAWVLVLFDRLKRVTGKSRIIDIWPTLRLIIHGGTRFDPYREVFRREIGSDVVRFLDTYPSSEGYVATEDPRYDLLRLIPDHDVFFEFVPVAELDRDRPTRHTLADLETGVQYAVVLSTCAGLWSYVLGDTVAFERRDPPLLRFTGRTKYFLSAFGEHLIQDEIEQAMKEAAGKTGAEYVDFHVGPVFPSDPGKPGHHLYLIEFTRLPADMEHFRTELDAALSRINEDYAAHRIGDLTMLLPEVQVIPPGGATAWVLARGKDAQGKFPRMDNTGQVTQQLRRWFEENAGGQRSEGRG